MDLFLNEWDQDPYPNLDLTTSAYPGLLSDFNLGGPTNLLDPEDAWINWDLLQADFSNGSAGALGGSEGFGGFRSDNPLPLGSDPRYHLPTVAQVLPSPSPILVPDQPSGPLGPVQAPTAVEPNSQGPKITQRPASPTWSMRRVNFRRAALDLVERHLEREKRFCVERGMDPSDASYRSIFDKPAFPKSPDRWSFFQQSDIGQKLLSEGGQDLKVLYHGLTDEQTADLTGEMEEAAVREMGLYSIPSTGLEKLGLDEVRLIFSAQHRELSKSGDDARKADLEFLTLGLAAIEFVAEHHQQQEDFCVERGIDPSDASYRFLFDRMWISRPHNPYLSFQKSEIGKRLIAESGQASTAVRGGRNKIMSTLYHNLTDAQTAELSREMEEAARERTEGAAHKVNLGLQASTGLFTRPDVARMLQFQYIELYNDARKSLLESLDPDHVYERTNWGFYKNLATCGLRFEADPGTFTPATDFQNSNTSSRLSYLRICEIIVLVASGAVKLVPLEGWEPPVSRLAKRSRMPGTSQPRKRKRPSSDISSSTSLDKDGFK